MIGQSSDDSILEEMWPTVRAVSQEKGHGFGFICNLFHVEPWNTPSRRSQEASLPRRQVSVSCKGMISLLLSPSFVQYFAGTNATTVHHEKEKTRYYCNQAWNGVAQGLLLWCGGGRYRLESSMINEWNLSPHILAKWIIIQGHTERDFQRKEWVLPFAVPLKFLKKGYRHMPSEEECTDCGAGVENIIFWQTQENPPTHLTPSITYCLIQGQCKWCDSGR